MGVAVWLLALAAVAYAPDWPIAGLAAVVVVGMGVYTAAAAMLGAFRVADVRAALARPRS